MDASFDSEHPHGYVGKEESIGLMKDMSLHLGSPVMQGGVDLTVLARLLDDHFEATVTCMFPAADNAKENAPNTFMLVRLGKKEGLLTADAVSKAKELIISGRHQEVLAWKEVKEVARKKATRPVSTCLICYGNLDGLRDDMLCCQKEHPYCSACFNEHVKTKTFASLDARSDGLDLQMVIKRKGTIPCPHPDCATADVSFAHDVVAKHCNPDVVERYMVTYAYAQQQHETMDKIQQFIKSVSEKLPAFDRENRRMNLKRACPDARMCRKCEYGPIERSHCDDLQTHAHQFQNACPRCGDHAKRWTDLPKWDGRLAEESAVIMPTERVEEPGGQRAAGQAKAMCLRINTPVDGWIILSAECTKAVPLHVSEQESAFMVLGPPKDLIHIFEKPPHKVPIKTLVKLKGTIKSGTIVQCKGKLRLREALVFVHCGSWTGCGGNPDGTAVCTGSGNCSPHCKNCGSNTHYTCCGSTNRNSIYCRFGMQKATALRNVSICRQRHPRAVSGEGRKHKTTPIAKQKSAEEAHPLPNYKIRRDPNYRDYSQCLNDLGAFVYDTYLDQRPMAYLKTQLGIFYKIVLGVGSSKKKSASNLPPSSSDCAAAVSLPTAHSGTDRLLSGSKDEEGGATVVPLRLAKKALGDICRGFRKPASRRTPAPHYRAPPEEELCFAYAPKDAFAIERFETLLEQQSATKTKKTTTRFLGFEASVPKHSGFHIVDLDEKVVFSPSGNIHGLMTYGAALKNIAVVSTAKYSFSDWKSAAGAQSTRQVAVTRDWKSFSTLAEEALGHPVTSAHIIRQSSPHNAMRPSYVCVALLNEQTYPLQLPSFTPSDIIACHKTDRPAGTTARSQPDQTMHRRMLEHQRQRERERARLLLHRRRRQMEDQERAPENDQGRHHRRPMPQSRRVWEEGPIECGRCTYHNQSHRSSCEMCGGRLILGFAADTGRGAPQAVVETTVTRGAPSVGDRPAAADELLELFGDDSD
jgi:hypothetical protein